MMPRHVLGADGAPCDEGLSRQGNCFRHLGFDNVPLHVVVGTVAVLLELPESFDDIDEGGLNRRGIAVVLGLNEASRIFWCVNMRARRARWSSNSQ